MTSNATAPRTGPLASAGRRTSINSAPLKRGDRNLYYRTILTILLMLACSLPLHADTPAPASQPVETKVQKDARLAWWREAKFGLFIHWGIYSVPAGEYHGKPVDFLGEWIMNTAQIPVAEYAGYAKQFNPTQFNADDWASLAKAAGMKYVVITSKHHDGFAMFKSNASKFNVVDGSPFKRDVIKELSEACKKQGLKFGVYYSQSQDWHHPGGAHAKLDFMHRDHDWWDPAQQGSFDDYLKTIAIPQVRELLTNYQPDILWYDTPMAITPEQAAPLHALQSLRPGLITNNRLGGGFSGDSETPEQEIPANGFPAGRDWESCMTINDTWGFKKNDKSFKSTKVLLTNLIDIVSKGGNYLLNVGPDSTGTIPPEEADRLREIGQWLKVNGESIYGTRPSPFKESFAWGKVTTSAGKLYLHVLHWPADGRLSIPTWNSVSHAFFLADPSRGLAFETASDATTIFLPAAAPDPNDTVIVLEGPTP